MLDIMGSGYVIEHCIAAFRVRQRAEAYQIYVTDCLAALAGGFSGAKGVKRFAEILYPPKEDKRKPQDIVTDITKRAGLKVVDG